MFCHIAELAGAMVVFRNSRKPEVSVFFWACDLMGVRNNPKSMVVRNIFFIINSISCCELHPPRILIHAKWKSPSANGKIWGGAKI